MNQKTINEIKEMTRAMIKVPTDVGVIVTEGVNHDTVSKDDL